VTVVLMAVPTVVLVRKGLRMAALRKVPATAVLMAVPRDLLMVAQTPTRQTVEPTAVQAGVPEVGDATAGGRAASGRAPGSSAMRDG
jgi:hypothetical protein